MNRTVKYSVQVWTFFRKTFLKLYSACCISDDDAVDTCEMAVSALFGLLW